MTEIGSLPTTQSIFSIHENSFYDHESISIRHLNSQATINGSCAWLSTTNVFTRERMREKKRQDGSYSLILLWWYVSLNTFILIAVCVKAREGPNQRRNSSSQILLFSFTIIRPRTDERTTHDCHYWYSSFEISTIQNCSSSFRF
jgi:hypothetical protein